MSDGLGIDLTPWTNLATTVAQSAAQVEAARQSANAARAMARAPAPAAQAPSRGISPLLIVGVLGVLGVGGYFLLRGKRGGRRR
jgi:hypothetical protein